MRSDAQRLPIVCPGRMHHTAIVDLFFLGAAFRLAEHGGRKIHAGHMTHLGCQGNRQGAGACAYIQNRPSGSGCNEPQTLLFKGSMLISPGKGGGAFIPHRSGAGFPAGIVLSLLPELPPIKILARHRTSLLFLRTGKYVDREPHQRVHFLLLGNGLLTFFSLRQPGRAGIFL